MFPYDEHRRFAAATKRDPQPPNRHVSLLLPLLNILLPLGYLLAVLSYGVLFLSEPAWAHRVAPRIARTLVVIHAAYLVLSGATFEHVPVANMWEAFTFIAFALAAVYVALEWRLGTRTTGVFLLAPPLVFQIASSAFVTHTREVDEILRSPWFGVHVTTALLGFAALTIAAVYGMMYTLLYRSLKRGRVGLVFRRLPDLEALARLNWHAILAGWVNLTVAIAVGMIWVSGLEARGELAGNFLGDPKFISTVVIWALYGASLAGRLVFRWPSKRLALVSVFTFVLMLVSSMGISLFLESFHQFE